MRYILILLLLVGTAYGQSQPTSAKTRFVNGLYMGTKLDSYFNTADSNAIYWRADSVVMAKYKGTARALAFASALGSYKLIADTFFTGGYTTRARTKQYGDSIAVLKLNIGDTATMLSNYRRATTKIVNSDLENSTISGVALGSTLSGLINSYGISGSIYNGSAAQIWFIDTSLISTKANVTGALVAKLNISDTAAMLSGYKTYYPRTAISAGTGISYDAATGVITNTSPSSGGTVTSIATSAPITGGTITSTGTIGITQSTTTTDGYLSSTDWNTFNNKASTASVALKLNISDTASMLSNYRRKTTLIENADLRNSTISGISLGSNLNSLTAGNGLTGTAYNGGTAYTWQVDTSTISTKANVTGLLVGYATTGSLSGYLPLTGGTLTGGLNGTTGNFSGNLGGGTLISSGAAQVESGVLFKHNATVSQAGYASISSMNGTGFNFIPTSGTIHQLTMPVGTGYTYTFPSASGTLALTSSLSGYLPLSAGSGQPLSGALYVYNGSAASQLFLGTAGTQWQLGRDNISTGNFRIREDGTTYLTIATGTGNTTLSGSLSGTSLSMSGGGSFGTTSGGLVVGTSTIEAFAKFKVRTGTDNNLAVREVSGVLSFDAYNDATSANIPLRYYALSHSFNGGNTLIKTTTDNGTDALQVAGSGLFTGVSGETLKAIGVAGEWVQRLTASSSTNNSFGLIVNAGTSTSDIAFKVTSQSGGTDYLSIRGDGLNTIRKANITGGTGELLTVTGVAGDWAQRINGSSSSGNSYGLIIAAGTTSGDRAFSVFNQNLSTQLFTITGAGAATFSSSVTASSLIKSGGTSAQFLKADGSVDGSTYLTSAGAVTSIAGTTNQITVSASTGAVTVSLPSAVTISGAMTASGFIVSSDRRLKNIVSRIGDMVTYTLKADKDKILHYGYIAQEVEKVLPTTVSTDDKGMKAVNYIEVLVKKVNDLEKKIEQLEKLLNK